MRSSIESSSSAKEDIRRIEETVKDLERLILSIEESMQNKIDALENNISGLLTREATTIDRLNEMKKLQMTSVKDSK